jgi:hypothetical protein
VVIATNSTVRWLSPWFCMPARGKNVFLHLISFLATVERTAVAARHASPGTGQEGPLLGHDRTESERRPGWAAVPFSLPHFHTLSPTPLLETLAATSFLGFLVGVGVKREQRWKRRRPAGGDHNGSSLLVVSSGDASSFPVLSHTPSRPNGLDRRRRPAQPAWTV